jgi:hypothetical protein
VQHTTDVSTCDGVTAYFTIVVGCKLKFLFLLGTIPSSKTIDIDGFEVLGTTPDPPAVLHCNKSVVRVYILINILFLRCATQPSLKALLYQTQNSRVIIFIRYDTRLIGLLLLDRRLYIVTHPNGGNT